VARKLMEEHYDEYHAPVNVMFTIFRRLCHSVGSLRVVYSTCFHFGGVFFYIMKDRFDCTIGSC
jgi:hypothetical protein